MSLSGARSEDGLVFGIYPGSGVGVDPSSVEGAMGSSVISGPADDPTRIKEALDRLQLKGHPFLVRGYLHYIGSGKKANITPADMTQYVSESEQRMLDLAVCYRTNESNVGDWTNFLRSIIWEYGSSLAKLQVAEEPNNPNAAAGGDGGFKDVRRAIIEGIIAAKDEIQKSCYQVQVGFNAVPSFNPADDFWKEIASLGSNNPSFKDALDYVGFDFYPGVFRPLPPNLNPKDAVVGVLTQFRTVNLATGGIPPSIPIHITENGCPTSPTRSYEQQAATIEQVIRAIYQKRIELNITHYEFFDLRNADSSKPDLQFGLLRDDYTSKPAFETFRKVIAELTK